MGEIISAVQAAAIIGVDRTLVLKWCRQKRHFQKAQKLGRDWTLDKEEVEAVASQTRRRGAPDGNQNAAKK